MQIICKKCDGNGLIPVRHMDYSITCPYCKMQGTIEIPDGKNLCPQCEGRGKVEVQLAAGQRPVPIRCTVCFGYGFIDDDINVEAI